MKMYMLLLVVVSALVLDVAGQGQVAPGKRKPPFIVVPPESERIKGAASEIEEVATAPFDPPEVGLSPGVFNPSSGGGGGGFLQPNFPQGPPEVVLPPKSPMTPQQPSEPSADADRVLDRRCYDCLCQASTNCSAELNQCLLTGPNQYFCGFFHISWAYWADGGKPGDVNGDPLAFERCLLDRNCAERAILGYMSKFKRDCNKDGVVDCVDFAMIHKAGPQDCGSSWIIESNYWKQFLQCWGTSGPSGIDFRSRPRQILRK